jgi:hypothetical protein
MAWEQPTNWSTGVVPGLADTAVFTNTGGTTVPGTLTNLLSESRTIGGLVFSQGTSKHLTDLGGNTLTVQGSLSVGFDQLSTGTTAIRNGRLVVEGEFSEALLGIGQAANANAVLDLNGLAEFEARLTRLAIAQGQGRDAAAFVTLADCYSIEVG